MTGRATTLIYREGLRGSNWRAQSLSDNGAPRVGPLAEIIEPGEHVIVLLPGDDVAARVIDVPNVRGRELREAALSVLEPNLAEPVAALTLACFRLSRQQALAVWVRRGRLAAWMGAVAAAGGIVVAAVPDWLLLYRAHAPKANISKANGPKAHTPKANGRNAQTSGARALEDAQVWCIGEKIWLLSSAGAALCTEPEFLPDVVTGLAADGRRPDIHVHGDLPAGIDARAADSAVLKRGAQPADWHSLWGQFGNVEQMDLRRVSSTRTVEHRPLPWRMAVVGLAFASLVAGAFVFMELNALEAERDRWDASSAAVFRATFPQEARVVDVKRQLRLKLQGAKGAGADSADALKLLDGFTRAMSPQHGLQVTALAYESGRLVASLEAGAMSEFEQLRQRAATVAPELAPKLVRLIATSGKAEGELHLEVPR